MTLVTKYAGVDLASLGVECEILEGVESAPPVRGLNLVIPYQHGQRWVPKYYDERPVVLKGLMIPTASGSFMYSTDALRQLFAIGLGEQKLEVSRPDGRTRYIMAEVRNTLGLARDGSLNPFASKFSIELVASDPLWYGSLLENSGGRQAWFLDGASAASVFSDSFENTARATTQTLFRSIGTDATGTLNAWTSDNGSASIAANVVTYGANSRHHAGHPDWGDMTLQARFKFTTNSTPTVIVHQSPDLGSYVYGECDGTHLNLNRVLLNVFGTAVSVVVPLVNGTQYWFQVVCAGNTYTVKIFADNAGAINLGSQVGATASGTFGDAIPTGVIALGTIIGGGSVGTTFGGAFANVCQVTGPAPAGWTPSVGGGEPAFCWSAKAPFSGARSLSITTTGAVDNGYWRAPALPSSGSGTVAVAIKTSQAVGSVGCYWGGWIIGPGIPGGAGPWQQLSGAATFNAAGFGLYAENGAGTSYFDYLMVVPGTIGAPVLLDDGAHWLDSSGPFFAQTLSGSPVNIEASNGGSYYTRKPVFTLSGTLVNPMIVNQRNGYSLQILGTFANTTPVIDCGAQTVNGAPASVILGAGQTDWMRLESGENTLTITGAAGAAYQAQYSPAYL
jgi:hypothetical protein